MLQSQQLISSPQSHLFRDSEELVLSDIAIRYMTDIARNKGRSSNNPVETPDSTT